MFAKIEECFSEFLVTHRRLLCMFVCAAEITDSYFEVKLEETKGILHLIRIR